MKITWKPFTAKLLERRVLLDVFFYTSTNTVIVDELATASMRPE